MSIESSGDMAKKLFAMSLNQRRRYLLSRKGNADALSGGLTPTERALLFPDYFKKTIPEHMRDKDRKVQGRFGSGPDGLGTLDGVPVTGNTGPFPGQKEEQATKEQREAITAVLNNQPLTKRQQSLIDDVPKKLRERSGITKQELPGSADGSIGGFASRYVYTPPPVSQKQIDARVKSKQMATKPGSDSLAGSSKRQKQVYDAFINAGYNDAQARAFTAEVGRENDYQDKHLFGSHTDPHNKKTNSGFMSWQKGRGTKLIEHLTKAGVMTDGKIHKSQEALDEMAKFTRHEIETNPAYAKTKKNFLENKNGSYEEYTKTLGTNYIRWRYNDKKYASHHKRRNAHYNNLNNTLAKKEFQQEQGFSSAADYQMASESARMELVREQTRKSGQTIEQALIAKNKMNAGNISVANTELTRSQRITVNRETTAMGGKILPLGNSPYSSPVLSGTMLHDGHGRTSEYGYGRGRLHAGIDAYVTDQETGKLLVGESAKVYAPAGGKITLIRKNRGRAGNYIEMQDKAGIKHRFLHTAGETLINPKTNKPYKPGDAVAKGQHLTYVTGSGTAFGRKAIELGSTNAAMAYFNKNGWGSTNKPHLHYETRTASGKSIDPAQIFPVMSMEQKGTQIGNIKEVAETLAKQKKTNDLTQIVKENTDASLVPIDAPKQGDTHHHEGDGHDHSSDISVVKKNVQNNFVKNINRPPDAPIPSITNTTNNNVVTNQAGDTLVTNTTNQAGDNLSVDNTTNQAGDIINNSSMMNNPGDNIQNLVQNLSVDKSTTKNLFRNEVKPRIRDVTPPAPAVAATAEVEKTGTIQESTPVQPVVNPVPPKGSMYDGGSTMGQEPKSFLDAMNRAHRTGSGLDNQGNFNAGYA